MASVDGITPIHVRTDGVPRASILPEDIRFVRAGMGTEYGIFVDVVGI